VCLDFTFLDLATLDVIVAGWQSILAVRMVAEEGSARLGARTPAALDIRGVIDYIGAVCAGNRRSRVGRLT
jgi:hypothetical protein